MAKFDGALENMESTGMLHWFTSHLEKTIYSFSKQIQSAKYFFEIKHTYNPWVFEATLDHGFLGLIHCVHQRELLQRIVDSIRLQLSTQWT